MMISRTSRLLKREATAGDAEFILNLVNEPAWLNFISDHSIDSLEKSSKYIEEIIIASYIKYGFGLWVVEKREDKVPIGICGLLKRNSLDSVDLGFAFLSDYWGQGFATEAAMDTLIYAKEKIKTDKVFAISDPLNDRSIKLLKNLGFFYEREFSHPGSEAVLSLYLKSDNYRRTPVRISDQVLP